ncbi:MAG: hypothetical protein KME15_10525 [Drouetiella hepatica Uher 2000/2452]|jgi:uncharacterized Zn finger protein|uniref:SWIM-type domain-containing protein n=1 Tax=Drouetiella hepatica Uher 2000/2452 TaxID=904376 RepID=A0A951QAN7_9CYAN|nr:hypothetical protein [Drouetiella hepatica Uher 2000/2452]
MRSPFANLLTSGFLEKTAGAVTHQRGQAYFKNGQVQSLLEEGEVISAEVQGSEEYQVEFWIEEDGGLAYQCDCPVGGLCKHCVAVGLAWLARPAQKSGGMNLQDVRQYLNQQSKDTLVQMIVDRALRDGVWRNQLTLKAAAARPKGLDIKTFEQALRKAIAVKGYIDYGETRAYTRNIKVVIESIAKLLEDHAQAVMELCEYAMPLLNEATQSIDDSDGDLGEIMSDVQELHHQACQKVKPDPIALADRLYQLEMADPYEIFYGAAEEYADVLGTAGANRYQKRAEADWEKLPPSTPGQINIGHRKLSSILENLARQRGDLEVIVAIKSRSLFHPYNYLQIAQLYQEDGQTDRALQWAENGLKAFPDRIDSRLQDFLRAEYQRRGRFADAMALVWKEFTASTSLANYQKLKTEADRKHKWAEWRERAIAYIREQIKQNQKAAKTTSPYSISWQFRDHSLLVEILLWEEDIDSAWQEAQQGKCSKQLWLKLADARQKDHPEDALSIYLQEIEPLIQQTNNNAYAQAIEFVKKAKKTMLKMGLRSQFEAYTQHLQKTYRNKRNFIKLLIDQGLD